MASFGFGGPRRGGMMVRPPHGGPVFQQPQDQQYPADHTGFRIEEIVQASAQDELYPSWMQSEAADNIDIKSLSNAEVEELYARVKPYEAKEDEEKDFFMREKTLPAPKVGNVVLQPFPPKDDKVGSLEESDLKKRKLESEEFKVVKFMPEGNLEEAPPHLSVSFSHAVVPLATLEQLNDIDVPIKILPGCEGRWKYMGTKNLTFEPKYRFPSSTNFTVMIPEGTKSVHGNSLKKTFHFSFTTPTVKLTASHPSGTTKRQPLMFMSFNQKINQRDFIRFIQVWVDKSSFGVRLASQNEIDDDERVKSLVKSTFREKPAGGQEPRDNWIAFTTETALPADASVRVLIKPGAPSAEGPLTNTSEQSYSFRTYGPLRFVEAHSTQEREIYSTSTVQFQFTNELNEEEFDADRDVAVVDQTGKPIEDVSINCNGYGIYVNLVNLAPKSDVKVTIRESLQDVYHQNLEKQVVKEFVVRKPAPSFSSSINRLVIADPATGPKLVLTSLGFKSIRVAVFQVSPGDFTKRPNRWVADTDPTFADPDKTVQFGKKVYDQVIQTKGTKRDGVNLTVLDLVKFLQHPEEKLGHLFVFAVPREPKRQVHNIPRHMGWVQSTKIGLDCFETKDGFFSAWTNSLENGAPLSGVRVSPLGQSPSYETDASGLAVVKSTCGGPVLATKGNDSVILEYFTASSPTLPTPVWHIFNDRNLYKPKEKVNIKGYIREFVHQDANFNMSIPKGKDVSWTLRDPQWNEISKGSAKLDDFGAFHVEIAMPDNINLGNCQVQFQMEQHQLYHSFMVQEFRTPEYSVTANVTSGPNHFVNGHAVVSAEAKYFAGEGKMSNSRCNWTVRTAPSFYSPPNWSGFSFGQRNSYFGRSHGSHFSIMKTFAGSTDSEGKHSIKIKYSGVDSPPAPVSVTAGINVQDINRQTIAGETSFTVHPSKYYVGIKSDVNFAKPKEKIPVQIIVTDVDGKAISGVKISFVTLKSVSSNRRGRGALSKQKKKEISSQDLVSGAEPIATEVSLEEGGQYSLEARIEDDVGNANSTSLGMSIWGGNPQADLVKGVNQMEITLKTDKTEYQVGDVAVVNVTAPFPDGEGLYISKSGYGKAILTRFTMKGTEYQIKLPISDKEIPSFGIFVEVVGTDHAKPAYAVGNSDIKVSRKTKELKISVETDRKKATPGSNLVVDLQITNDAKAGVANSSATLLLVDEAILSMSGYQMPNPMDAMYAGVNDMYGYVNQQSHSRFLIQLLSEKQTMEETAVAPEGALMYGAVGGAPGGGGARGGMMKRMAAPMMAMAAAPMMAQTTSTFAAASVGGAPVGAPIEARTIFKALAAYYPDLRTDKDGKVRVTVKLPDNLTKFRIWAVAVAEGNLFGVGESTVEITQPLMIRPSLPRFFNFGDRAELPVVVQNQTEETLELSAAIRAYNVQIDNASRGFKCVLPPSKRVELRFPADANLRVGNAHFQVVCSANASNNSYADAVEVDVPIFTPATTEGFATYGEIDEGDVIQPIVSPKNVFTQFGGLEISTSSTALQSITDAVIYLWNYPYECAEQISSRVLAIVALRDILTAFKSDKLPTASEIEKNVKGSISKLRGLQKDNGGFGFWTQTSETSIYVTNHVTHMLVRAKAKGYEVDEGVLQSALGFLKDIEKHFTKDWTDQLRIAATSYSLSIRKLAADPTASADAVKLLGKYKFEQFSMESLGWLLPVLPKGEHVTKILQHVTNRSVETAETANFISSYSDNNANYLLLHSDRRTDGVILESLIEVDRANPLIPKIVKGLLAHRSKKGQWGNTQDNVFVLLALDRYFAVYESVVPDFSVTFGIDNRYAGETKFSGRSTEAQKIQVPMKYLADLSEKTESKDVLIHKEGKGRLYYRLGLTYAPLNLQLPAAEYGFTVERTYEGVDDKDHVKRDKDGVWRFKSGERIRVTLTISTPSRRYHVALQDKLPAGIEALNPALKTSGAVEPELSGGSFSWWRRTWYEHQNLRDERVEAFSTLLWEGSYQYSYVAQTTTPGKFVIPPALAEEMYSPEVFGRTSTDSVIIE
eukprot:TRINITY_DN2261_c0_g1_i2.p1 TRINITY_DN2261_c0_g1~~TRINITY_DN2261_c0_g1_i2.p1  ORF type:complete len:2056 (+),score=444.22 TRINITY_DN2261_c0_g1_i2:68-6169(+)